jgi:hypothetical protein
MTASDPLRHLGEDACIPHECSDMRDHPRMSPAAAHSRGWWLIRATGAASFHMRLPPCAREVLERRTIYSRLGSALTVRNARLALPNFYNITVGIADVAARLAILFLWLRYELGSAASP